MTLPDVLNAAEVAALLRVSPYTVAAMARKGTLHRLPGMRVLRFSRASIELYLEGYSVRGRAAFGSVLMQFGDVPVALSGLGWTIRS